VAIRVARFTGFLDRPAGYKGHGQPTPYLGGSAIMAGVVVAGLAFGAGTGGFGVLIGCGVVLWAVGTIDDGINLSPYFRLAVQAAVAMVLFETGHGWSVLDNPAGDLALTIFWVIGIVNAVNLMDNMNGAAATTAAVSTAAAGALALLVGDPALGALSFAVSGACVAFLHFNLARPSRIFMGDGGSMPLGLLVAYVTMQAALTSQGDFAAVLAAGLLVAAVILDTTLVIISRRRRGRPVLSGGRDHLTHRLARRLGTPDRVAGALATAQGGLAAVTIVAANRGGGWVALVGSTALTAGVVVLWVLEQPPWSVALDEAPQRPHEPAPAPARA
jgi:UDP-GlcNAc:undecaprenyl-phosphate GlcNAc-1-phosphate transferase